MSFNFARDSVYGARFDTARALTEDEMRAVAPSIFAVTAHESRSERFAPIPTIEVLRGLAKEGFHPVGARQSTTRVPGKENFTKHLVRLRRLDGSTKYQVGDTVHEILLKNGNDGTCRYNLLSALFRIACLNSMVAFSESLGEVKIGHSGNLQRVSQAVIEGTYRVLDDSEKALAAPAEWSCIALAAPEQEAFAEAAHLLRFDPDNAPVKPADLLQVNRREDMGTDLWTTFNRVQENSLRGGLHGSQVNARGVTRRVTTRPVKAIDADIKLNKALFTLAARMAELKG